MNMNNREDRGQVPEWKDQQPPMAMGQGNWMDPAVIARMANKMYREFLERFPESRGAMEMAMKSMGPAQEEPAGEIQRRQGSIKSGPSKKSPPPPER